MSTSLELSPRGSIRNPKKKWELLPTTSLTISVVTFVKKSRDGWVPESTPQRTTCFSLDQDYCCRRYSLSTRMARLLPGKILLLDLCLNVSIYQQIMGEKRWRASLVSTELDQRMKQAVTGDTISEISPSALFSSLLTGKDELNTSLEI